MRRNSAGPNASASNWTKLEAAYSRFNAVCVYNPFPAAGVGRINWDYWFPTEWRAGKQWS